MNIHEFSKRFGLTMQKARSMEKAGVLQLDPEGDDMGAAVIRNILSRGAPLSAIQYATLIHYPGVYDMLGARNEPRAKAAVAALGNVKSELAPPEIMLELDDAAGDDPAAVKRLALWIGRTIPTHDVSHAYLAVRLLLASKPADWDRTSRRINSAFSNVRKQPYFASFWRLDKSGQRGQTFYKKPLDL